VNAPAPLNVAAVAPAAAPTAGRARSAPAGGFDALLSHQESASAAAPSARPRSSDAGPSRVSREQRTANGSRAVQGRESAPAPRRTSAESRGAVRPGAATAKDEEVEARPSESARPAVDAPASPQDVVTPSPNPAEPTAVAACVAAGDQAATAPADEEGTERDVQVNAPAGTAQPVPVERHRGPGDEDPKAACRPPVVDPAIAGSIPVELLLSLAPAAADTPMAAADTPVAAVDTPVAVVAPAAGVDAGPQAAAAPTPAPQREVPVLEAAPSGAPTANPEALRAADGALQATGRASGAWQGAAIAGPAPRFDADGAKRPVAETPTAAEGGATQAPSRTVLPTPEGARAMARRLVSAALAQVAPEETGTAASDAPSSAAPRRADAIGATSQAPALRLVAARPLFEQVDLSDAVVAVAATPDAAEALRAVDRAEAFGSQGSGSRGSYGSSGWRAFGGAEAMGPRSSVSDAVGGQPGTAPVFPALAVAGAAAEAVTGTGAAPDVDLGTTAVLDSHVERQLVRTISLAWRNDQGEAHVRLSPEHLGEVTVSLKVERGAVSAVLQAETAAAREWISAHEDDLRQGLASCGLDLESLVVTWEGAGSRGQDQPPARRRPAPPPPSGAPVFQVEA
jgi:hypothetical protein